MSCSSSNRKGVGAWLGGALLNVLAALGVVCLVLVVLGFAFNVSIVMFKTGSMSPTIPAGSIAFVREIPAQEMEVGDVVTVDRGESTLPVTHRVITIDDVDGSSGKVTFELRGDANDVKDPEPYTAETVRRVMFSVPGLAPLIQQWRNPFLLGGITIAASLLVVWAFWPRRGDDAGDDEESPESPRSPVESLRAPAHTPKHAVATPVVVALVLGSGALGVDLPNSVDAAVMPVAAPAGNDSASEAHGDVLRMKAFGDEKSMRNLSPGASAKWSVDVWADALDPGEVEVEIGSGNLAEPLASALLVDVRSCPRTGDEEGCPESSSRLLSGVPLSDLGAAPDDNRALFAMSSDESTRVEVTVTLEASADSAAVAGLTSSVRLTAIGHGEEISLGPGFPGDPGPDGPSGDLPRTGVDGWQWILAAAFVLIVVGSAVVARSRKAARP